MEKYDFDDINNESIPDIVVLQEYYNYLPGHVVLPSVTGDAPTYYTPLYHVTAFYGTIFVLSFLFIRIGKSAGQMRVCVMLASFYMWLIWVTVYIAQLNPVMSPLVENSTLAWLSYKGAKPEVTSWNPYVPRPPYYVECDRYFNSYEDCGYTYIEAATWPQYLFSHGKYGQCQTPKKENCLWYITWPTAYSDYRIKIDFQHFSIFYSEWIPGIPLPTYREHVSFLHVKLNNRFVGKYGYRAPTYNMLIFTPDVTKSNLTQNISLNYISDTSRFHGFQLEFHLIEPEFKLM